MLEPIRPAWASRVYPLVALVLGAVGVLALEVGRLESSRPVYQWLLAQGAVAGASLLVAWRGQDRLSLVALLVIALAVRVAFLGIHSWRDVGHFDPDAHVYATQGHSLLHGDYPSSEYPTGAVLLFALDSWLGGISERPISILMVPFQLLTVAGIWACRTRWSGWLAALVAVWPLDEYFREWRFDFAATALLVTGLAVALRGRFGLAGLLFGVGTAVKWTPGLAALTLLVWLVASGRLSAAGRHVQGFAWGFVGLTLPFLAWSPHAVLAAYSKQGGRELMGESLPYLTLRWLGLADRVTDPWQTVTAPRWASPAAITIQLALLAATLAVAAAVRANLRAGVAVAALAPVIFLLTNRIFSPQFLVLMLAAWCVAIALLARSAREQLFLGAATAAASAANVFVFPYALSIELWHASSTVLFAIALGVTGWLLIRAWSEEREWGTGYALAS